MTSSSHAARRSAKMISRDFPHSPTLPRETPCDGVAIILDLRAPEPDLRALREAVVGLWRGRLDAESEGADLFVALFAAPTPIVALAAANMLPLRAARGTLASFAQVADEQAPGGRFDADHVREVDLWWRGRLRRVALDGLQTISIATLWDMPNLAVHLPHAPSAESRRGEASKAEDLKDVSHARGALFEPSEDVLAGVALRLTDLEARTRLGSILRQALGGLLRGRGTTAAGDGAPREPSVLENLIGWVRWHSPLGASLMRSLQGRMDMVEKLIAQRDIDGALKMALALGGAAGKSRFPLRLGGPRRSLDFRVRSGGAGAPLLGGAAYLNLRQRYAELAGRLEAEGDHRRAAFIWSQLINDHRRAVLVLEAGKLFREGAKLAIDSQLEPKIPIRLLFKAGDQDAALAHAKRTACFEHLAEDSRQADDGAYHAFVIKAWTDMLIETGQPLRALQVTDRLAQDPVAAQGLSGARQRWLRAALRRCGGDGLDAELTVRAMVMAPWSEPGLAGLNMSAFPDTVTTGGPDPFGMTIERLQDIINGQAEDAQRLMIDLLAAFGRLADPSRTEQAPFWKTVAQTVIERFVLQLVEGASPRLRASDFATMEDLLQKAGLPVLATDLGKLRKLYAAKPQKSPPWPAPPPAVVRAAVRRACLLGNGDMAVWRESGFLELLDRHGGLRWRWGLEDVLAMVAVGVSPHVIVLQAQREGPPLLTRFDSHARTFHSIGRVNLRAAHDITSDGQWLVQIGGDIGALDLAKLCAPSPQVEFLWSCALTERVRAIAFAHHHEAPAWLTCDVSEHRFGVIELWSLLQTGKLTTNVCLPPPAVLDEVGSGFVDWFWVPHAPGSRISRPGPVKTIMPTPPWSDQTEKMALSADGRIRVAAANGRLRFQACDGDRPYVRFPQPPDQSGEPEMAVTALFIPDGAEPAIQIEHSANAGLSCLARSAPQPDRPACVLMGDEHGRLFVIDVATATVRTA